MVSYHNRDEYDLGPAHPFGVEQHMGKSSQLSQLKSAVSQAGPSRQPQSGRKRRYTQNEEKDNAKRTARLREVLNQFDVKVTKLKHDVGGRKLRGVSGKPAQSKQAGIEAVSRVHILVPSCLSTFLAVLAEENSSQRIRGEGSRRWNP